MTPFCIEKISEHITKIRDISNVSMFLVEGAEKALLIDTGTGFVGLKEYVDALTDKPLTVALTHMHPDHAGGAAEFSRVFAHPADIPAFQAMTRESRMNYATSQCLGLALTDSDFVETATEDIFVPMPSGMVFDLGGFHVEMIHVPGHTPGSCCALFQEERSILLGDACNPNTLIMFSGSIAGYRDSLQRLLKFHQHQFDVVYTSHGVRASFPPEMVQNNIELANEILAGKDDAIPCHFSGIPAFRAKAINDQYMRLDGKYGNIVYTLKTKEM